MLSQKTAFREFTAGVYHIENSSYHPTDPQHPPLLLLNVAKVFLLEDRFSRIHHQISSQQQLPLYQLSGFLTLPSSDPHWHDVVCWHLSGCICYYLTYINAVLPLDGILLQFVSWRFWSLCFPVSLALRVERIFFSKLQLKINLILNTSTLAHHLTKSTLSKVPLTLTFQQCYRSYNS